MTFELDVWQETEEDIAGAAAWYEQQSVGLGADFLQIAEDCLAHLAGEPERFPLVHGDVRRALLRRFPYGMFFFIDQDMVRVVACMHARRDPDRWQSRLPSDR